MTRLLKRRRLPGLAAAAILLALTGWVINAPNPRQRLTATQILWVVNNIGNDSFDCLTFNTACKTIPGAVNKAMNNYDTAGNTIQIQVQGPANSYINGATINGPLFGGGTLVITGQGGQASLTVTGGGAILAQHKARLQVANLKLSTITSGIALQGEFGALISFGAGMEFAASAAEQIDAGDFSVITSAGQAYTISGGGTSHIHSHSGGDISIDNSTVTCTGSPAFTQYFVGASWSYIEAIGATFSGCGTVTGPRFTGNRNAGIRTNTNNLSFFPGNSVGTVGSSAAYDDYTIQQRSISSGSTDTATAVDQVLYWNSASGAPKAQTLPACTSSGPWNPMTVADEFGDAATQNITIAASASTFDGAASKIINTAHGKATVKCDAVANYVTIQ